MTHDPRRSGLWRLFIDTGGTFTDCLAVTPHGELRRAKVLSSSALRGRVASWSTGRQALRVEQPWPLPKDFFAGYALRLLDGGGEGTVTGWNPETGELGVEWPAGAAPPVSAGAGFEIRSPEEAPILAARLVTGTGAGRPLPPVELRLATTRGTNALLERRGSRTALLITAGFGDLLEIGTQQRPDLFALDVVRPRPLYERVVEVAERRAADGSVLEPLDLEGLESVLGELLEDGVESFAVAFAHSFRQPDHELRVEELLLRGGARWISSSARLAPRIGLLARAQTAVVDAYLAPVVGRYVERVEGALAVGSRLLVMTSAGGLVSAGSYRAKDSLLSGPAGGVVGAAEAGQRSGFPRVVAFDMGGTSTDVSRCDGAYEYRYEVEVGGARLLAPALAIETVAAGGGSVCGFRDGRVQVGPESAGADPGPACYGAGGPLTLTDVNLLLGRLDPRGFEIPIEKEAARQAAEDLARKVAAGTGASPEAEGGAPLEALLQGLLDIADERMAEAIRAISVRRGYDPRDYTLVAFGGAGAQHACSVASVLGMERVLVPEDAALLSARGLSSAVVERFAEAQVLQPLADVAAGLEERLATLGAEARRQVVGEGFEDDQVEIRRRLASLRFVGQESSLEVAVERGESLLELFKAAYREVYGYEPEDRPVEVESLRVVASSRPSKPLGTMPGEEGSSQGAEDSSNGRSGNQDAGQGAVRTGGQAELRPARPAGEQRAWMGSAWRSVPVYRREQLRCGERLEGPALVFELHSATVVTPGWWGSVDAAGALVLERSRGEVDHAS